jgi:hypothetical protein
MTFTLKELHIAIQMEIEQIKMLRLELANDELSSLEYIQLVDKIESVENSMISKYRLLKTKYQQSESTDKK